MKSQKVHFYGQSLILRAEIEKSTIPKCFKTGPNSILAKGSFMEIWNNHWWTVYLFLYCSKSNVQREIQINMRNWPCRNWGLKKIFHQSGEPSQQICTLSLSYWYSLHTWKWFFTLPRRSWPRFLMTQVWWWETQRSPSDAILQPLKICRQLRTSPKLTVILCTKISVTSHCKP